MHWWAHRRPLGCCRIAPPPVLANTYLVRCSNLLTRSSLSPLHCLTMMAGPFFPYITLSFCRDKATTILRCFSSTKKGPLRCATWLPQCCSHYAAPLILHMNQPLMCTNYLPQGSRHSAEPLVFRNAAATMLRHLSSTMKQPLCCATYVPQRSGHSAAPLIVHNEAATMLRHLSLKMQDCLEGVASDTPLGQKGCMRHHKIFWPVSRCSLFPHTC